MKSVTKAEFDRQRKSLWVYLRHEGRCAVCGQGVDPDEAAHNMAIPAALGIDELLQVRLTHLHCGAGEGRADKPSGGSLKLDSGRGAATGEGIPTLAVAASKYESPRANGLSQKRLIFNTLWRLLFTLMGAAAILALTPGPDAASRSAGSVADSFERGFKVPGQQIPEVASQFIGNGP